FVRLGHARVLTVLVTTAGVVRDRLLALDHDLTPGELETAANYLNANFRGWALDRIRRELARRMELERSEYDRILASLEELQRIVDLLNAYVDSRRTSVRVVVGLEETMPEMHDLVLIAAPARSGSEH